MGRIAEKRDDVLLEVAQALTSRLDLPIVLPMILDQLARLAEYTSASIMLLEDDQLKPVAQRSIFPVNESPMSVRPAELRHLHDVITGNAPILIDDTAKDPRWKRRPGSAEIRNWLGVALLVDGHAIGLLNISHTAPNHFSTADVQTVATFAAFASIALNNAAIHQQSLNELAERQRIEHALSKERELLAQRVEEQTANLRVANQDMVRAARMKDEFLASMSHELRTPLNTIISMTDVLREEVYGAVNERQRRALERVADSSKHLLSLISDIRNVARIEYGHLHLIMQTVGLDEMCKASLVQVHPEAKALDVHYELAPAIPHITADERRLRQILLNLLSNAVKFTPELGAIGLEVSDLPANDAIAMTVWDTGIGISADDLRLLFQPFVQLDSSLARRYEGTGLGLTIIHRLTALHGGSLSVESEKGRGSRFTVRLPRQPLAAPVPDDRAFPADHRHPTVLLITGLEQASEQVAAQLRAAGCRVEVTLYGTEDYYAGHTPHLILINSHPPALGTQAMIRSIVETEALHDVPIAVAATLHLPGDTEAAHEAGAGMYFVKPLAASQIEQIASLAASRIS